MLFAVSGSQGCGKSTTLNELSKLYGYKCIERKTSRSILADWGVSLSDVNNDHKLTIRFQQEILNRKLEDEAFAAASSEIWLTERTFADLFVYALVSLGKDNEYSEWIDQYYAKCTVSQSIYTNIFYLQAGHFVPVNDGVRGINRHYSRMVDMTMFEYTHKMSLSDPSLVHVVSVSDLGERTSYIQNIIAK